MIIIVHGMKPEVSQRKGNLTCFKDFGLTISLQETLLPEDHPVCWILLTLYGGSDLSQAGFFRKTSIPSSLKRAAAKAVDKLSSKDRPWSLIHVAREKSVKEKPENAWSYTGRGKNCLFKFVLLICVCKGFHLNKLELAMWLWRRRFLYFVNVFFFCNYLPLEKGHGPSFESPSPKYALWLYNGSGEDENVNNGSWENENVKS